MSIKRKVMFAVAAGIFLSVNTFAQKDIFKRLEGAWTGSGRVLGVKSKLRMAWKPVLGSKHYRLEFHNRMEGGVTFEATAYYTRQESGRVIGTWFDSNGAVHPIRISVAVDSLTANWGTPQTEEGRTIYRLFAKDKMMEVVDFVKTKTGWREFGRSKFRKEHEINE